MDNESMGRGQSHGVLSMTPHQRGAALTYGAITGSAKAVHKVRSIGPYLAQKFGMSKRARIALYGTLLAAPVAALAGPLVGFGVALGMVAPRLMERAKEQKQQGLSPEETIAEEQAGTQAHEQLEPMLADANQEISALRARMGQMEQEFLRFMSEETDRQEALLAALKAERERAQAAEAALDASRRDNERLGSQYQALHQDHQDLADEHQQLQDKQRETEEMAARAEALAQQALAASGPKMSFPASPVMEQSYPPRTREQRDQFPDPAVMPLDAHWAEHILRGDTAYEFRKTRGNAKRLGKGSRVAIYAKAPAKSIVGYADIDSVTIGTPDEVWEQVKEDPSFGYTEAEFWGHCNHAKEVSVMHFANVQRLPQPISLDQLQIPGDAKRKGSQLQGFKCFEKSGRSVWHDQILTAFEQNDQQLAAQNGGNVPAGHGSETPSDMLAIAQMTVAREERKHKTSYSALSGARQSD